MLGLPLSVHSLLLTIAFRCLLAPPPTHTLPIFICLDFLLTIAPPLEPAQVRLPQAVQVGDRAQGARPGRPQQLRSLGGTAVRAGKAAATRGWKAGRGVWDGAGHLDDDIVTAAHGMSTAPTYLEPAPCCAYLSKGMCAMLRSAFMACSSPVRVREDSSVLPCMTGSRRHQAAAAVRGSTVGDAAQAHSVLAVCAGGGSAVAAPSVCWANHAAKPMPWSLLPAGAVSTTSCSCCSWDWRSRW